MVERSPEEWFHTVATHYVEAQILFHLSQVGVIAELARGEPISAERIAAERGLEPKILAPLLDYLALVSSIIRREGDQFVVTDFGRAVLDRYGVTEANGRVFNLFDVRVGAYGPVWAALGPLLRKEVTYGREIHRAGQYAFDGLYKLAARLVPPVQRILTELHASALVELGPTSGLLQRVGAALPELACYGIDRKQESLDEGEVLATQNGVDRIRWIRSDVHDVARWTAEVPTGRDVVVLSLHFHEFLSEGIDRMKVAIRALRDRMPGAHLLVIEQPRLPAADRDKHSTTAWLQGHANVLIHHLIENARCLSDDEWQALFEDAGCRLVSREATNCFGMTASVFAL